MEKYGAVCIGSQYSHLMAGQIELLPDGTIRKFPRAKPPADQPIRTTEDALRSIITEARDKWFKVEEYIRKTAITDFAKAFHVDGAIMPLWRGGRLYADKKRTGPAAQRRRRSRPSL
jgi:hypothetical protein